MNLYNHETGSGLHPCDDCGRYFERNTLEVFNGRELCPGCLTTAKEEDMFYNALECECCGEMWHKDELKDCPSGLYCPLCIEMIPVLALPVDNDFNN